MDGHISKDTAATLDVLERRGCGITRAQLDLLRREIESYLMLANRVKYNHRFVMTVLSITHHDGVSNFLLLYGLLDTLKVLVESTLKSNHQLDTSCVTGIDSFDGFSQIGGDRLFTKDVLSIGSCSLDLFGVVLRGRANPYGIDLGIIDDVHGIIGKFGHIVLLGGCRITYENGEGQ